VKQARQGKTNSTYSPVYVEATVLISEKIRIVVIRVGEGCGKGGIERGWSVDPAGSEE
jgi:hypothetical protein